MWLSLNLSHTPNGATMDTAKTYFYSSPMYNNFGTQYHSSVMFLELENQNLYTCSYGLWGISSWAPMGVHVYLLDNLALPTAKDDFCHIWLKFDQGFKWNKYFFYIPPPPNLVPFHGLSWATKTKCHG